MRSAKLNKRLAMSSKMLIIITRLYRDDTKWERREKYSKLVKMQYFWYKLQPNLKSKEDLKDYCLAWDLHLFLSPARAATSSSYKVSPKWLLNAKIMSLLLDLFGLQEQALDQKEGLNACFIPQALECLSTPSSGSEARSKHSQDSFAPRHRKKQPKYRANDIAVSTGECQRRYYKTAIS